jgi:hypothetical protein
MSDNSQQLIVHALRLGDRQLDFKTPVLIECLEQGSAPDHYYLSRINFLAVHAFANNKEELLAEVAEQVFQIWDRFQEVDDAMLSPILLVVRNFLFEFASESSVEAN